MLPWQDMIDKVGEEYHAMRTRLIAIAPEHGPRLRSLALTSSDTEFVAALQDIIHEAMEELSLDHSEQGDNAWQQFTRALSQKRAVVRPPEALSLSEWANKYAVLSKENAAQTGRFRSFKYQDGIMDAFTDPSVTQVSVMKSARVGYTKILDHAVAYYLSHDPSPIPVVQPRVEDAEDYSKTEIAPMLRDTPALKAIAGEAKAKDSGQTILKKQFSNGANLTLVGANSPAGFVVSPAGSSCLMKWTVIRPAVPVRKVIRLLWVSNARKHSGTGKSASAQHRP